MYNPHIRIALAFTGVIAACGGSTSGTTDTSQAALTASTTSASESTPSTECFTAFVTCLRDGGDEKTCHETLRTCVRPTSEGGGGGHCKRGGPGAADGGESSGAPLAPPGDHPDGDGDGPRGDGDHHGDGPRGDGDGDGDGPRGGHRGGGPGGACRACIDALVSCAQSESAVETCVGDAVSCVSAARASNDAPPADPSASSDAGAPALH